MGVLPLGYALNIDVVEHINVSPSSGCGSLGMS
jgi:hypothetical protein